MTIGSSKTLITLEELRQVITYHPDTGDMTWRNNTTCKDRIGEKVGGVDKYSSGGARLQLYGVSYVYSRLIWFIMTGQWPSEPIKFVDGDNTNYKWANLCLASKMSKKPKGICSIDGCTLKVYSFDLCGKHYGRLRRTGDPLKNDRRIAKDGEAKAFAEAAWNMETEECIDWPFSMSATGTAASGFLDGKIVLVGKAFCERMYGPAPEGYETAHSCGRGHFGCINKRHLSWKTRSENMQDKWIHGTSGTKLNKDQVSEIRKLQGVETAFDISVKYGVSPGMIGIIWRREQWAWVE